MAAKEGVRIKIGGREIPLAYSTLEMIEIEEALGCTAFQLNEEVFGIRREDEDDPSSVKFGLLEDAGKKRKLGTLLRILGNAGLEEAGEEPDLTDKWILRSMKPGMIMAYVIAAVAVISEGNRIERTTPAEEEGAVDEGLEEQTAKKLPGN